MKNIYQRLNRLLYATTLILFLTHPFNIIYYFLKGESFFLLIGGESSFFSFNSKLLPFSESTIALSALLIFPSYLLIRWVLTGRFTIRPS
ncbi:MAG: hypothetical protein HN761_04405 [Gammaproteobacteria bacterium]|jgi:hypothetical protein|nr:hypothetical protein [Gammaproteobacteria bacterium]